MMMHSRELKDLSSVFLNNTWNVQEIHEDPMYMGMYEPGAACPAWGKDWDCQLDGDFNLHQVKSVYSKVGHLGRIYQATAWLAHGRCLKVNYFIFGNA